MLDGLNRYAYCRNNPIKYVDPSGHGINSAADYQAQANNLGGQTGGSSSTGYSNSGNVDFPKDENGNLVPIIISQNNGSTTWARINGTDSSEDNGYKQAEQAFIKNMDSAMGQKYIGGDNDCDQWLENRVDGTGIDLKSGWGSAAGNTADDHKKNAGKGSAAAKAGLSLVVMEDNREKRDSPHSKKVESHVASVEKKDDGSIILREMGGHGADSHSKNYTSQADFEKSWRTYTPNGWVTYYDTFTYYPASDFY